jgi:sigma-B regulation protein RsbU (phosphoserine phosphatase)
MKILIAEDERITRRSLQRQLEQWGYKVVVVEDGAQAWEAFQQQQFDIVVTDWDMPLVDGRQLIELIRRSERSSYVYLIMLTGRSETGDLVAGMNAGADDFLSKPFERSELRVRLNAGERIIHLERKLAAQNKNLTIANNRMKHDLAAAAAVQKDLLPTERLAIESIHFAWHYEPCDELGGDILNVFPLDTRHVGMYLLDVSGHGVPAALLSVTLSRVLTTRDPVSSVLLATSENSNDVCVRSPKEVAERLNLQFPMESQKDRYFTMVYAVFDKETNMLQYALAGHPNPLLVRKGQYLQPLPGNGFPIGIIEDAEYETYACQLEPGDQLYFFSDGITEAMNENHSMLETEGLVKLIEENSTPSLTARVQGLIDGLKQWCGAVPAADDLSLLVLEVPVIRNKF